MKITEKDLRNWFPRDMRFLHFCAKYYGYSFHNDEVVERANHLAVLNVMRLVNRDQEFEDEAHMTGMVMSSFRYAILNAYTNSLSANEKNLEVRNDSELTYGVGDEEYSKYQASAVADTKEIDNLVDFVTEYAETNLPYLQRRALVECVIGESTMKELATDTDTSVRKVHLAKQKAIRRVKKLIGALNENEKKYGKEETNGKYISPSRSKLQIAIQLEPIRRDETRERDYSKAMSFVNTPPKV
jgi:DNA-directed RNA polymerase specialized sigma24 family protein